MADDTREAVRRWLADEGDVCSLQMSGAEQKAATALVRAGCASVYPRRCAHLRCRHYRLELT